MGFLSWPNMALLNPCFKDQIGLILGGKRTRREREGRAKKRRRGRGRRRGEEKRRDQVQKGMDAWILIWNFGFVWISCLYISLWVMGCRKPNPRRNLCMEIPLFL